MDKPLDNAIRIVGSATKLASALGVTKSAVGQWGEEGRRVPAEHCPEIERLTGHAVLCEELRPDINWMVVKERLRNRPSVPIEGAGAESDTGIVAA
ncbi:helix-turn-helix domain-containing protein [Pandoraea apista]|uniref:transcriptional regulator n=1 Tax=Pandoraea apista TaxID=93218 RepID=UPI002F928FCE